MWEHTYLYQYCNCTNGLTSQLDMFSHARVRKFRVLLFLGFDLKMLPRTMGPQNRHVGAADIVGTSDEILEEDLLRGSSIVFRADGTSAFSL